MDDLDLIRKFAAEDGEPDAGARERVAARVEWGMEARMAADGRPGVEAPASSSRGPARHPRRLRRLTIAATVAAAVLIALSFGIAQMMRPNPAQAAVQFSQDDGYIVAMVTDPFAAEQQLNAAFAAHHLDIDLKLVPVSPSIVGSVVFLEGADIQSIFDKRYDGPMGEQPVGLRIPTDFKGHASIVLGRPAKPGETYASAGDAFAPGEALHGVDLVGMKARDAARVLDKMGLTVAWRVDMPSSAGPASAAPIATPAPTSTPSPPPTPTAGFTKAVDSDDISKYSDYYVTSAVPKDQGGVYVFVQATRP